MVSKFTPLWGLFFWFFSACSENHEKDELLDFGGCRPIEQVKPPENLVTPGSHILDICDEYKGLQLENFDRVWDGWEDAPMALLVIDQEHEFLFTTIAKPEGFSETGFTELFARPRVFDQALKATFPAFSSTPTIVIGFPTAKDVETKAWKSTLWHEHFHQFQMSQPDYFSAVNDLGLSGGDETGMWMLNYPFPYEDKAVNAAFHNMALSLVAAYDAIDGNDFDDSLADYLADRLIFEELVGEDNFKYFDFQIWQEGLARYAELAAFKTLTLKADLKGDEYPFKQLEGALINLKRQDFLKENQRVAFYDFGLVEGLVLDAASPGWKSVYLDTNFQIEPLYGN